MDYSPPGSLAHGVSQARILEWVAVSCTRGSFWPRDQTHMSCLFCIDRQNSLPLCHLGSPIVLPNLFQFHWLFSNLTATDLSQATTVPLLGSYNSHLDAPFFLPSTPPQVYSTPNLSITEQTRRSFITGTSHHLPDPCQGTWHLLTTLRAIQTHPHLVITHLTPA